MEVTVSVPGGAARVSVVGAGERNLKMIREALGVRVTAREGSVRLSGERDAVHIARSVLERLAQPDSGDLSRQEVLDVIANEATRQREGLTDEGDRLISSGWDGTIDVFSGGRQIKPKTPNQQAYIEAIRDNDLVFGIGPAGTGKTYLAVAAAVHLLRTGRVKKVILCRPAVEAGERLGFLPGSLHEKVNPYLRPLFDALHDMMEFGKIERFMSSDVVEVAPLGYMRGRTLNNAVIILDEAQNTTRGQMKMFLTRMGHGSKVIVTGDTTQIDLPDPRESGLVDAARRLRKINGVAFVTLDGGDVVRHNLVQRVIDAYGEDDAEQERIEVFREALEDTGDETGGS